MMLMLMEVEKKQTDPFFFSSFYLEEFDKQIIKQIQRQNKQAKKKISNCRFWLNLN